MVRSAVQSVLVNRSVVHQTDGIAVEDDESLGRRAVARRTINAGERIVVWSGDVITGAEIARLPARERDYLLQIDDDRYLHAGLQSLAAADFINHSCDPNCGFVDARTLVAMREIPTGEAVTFDYAMSDTSAFVDFDCRCGSRGCRGRMTGEDWRRAELQARYEGWFAPHVQRLIEGAGNAGPGQIRVDMERVTGIEPA